MSGRKRDRLGEFLVQNAFRFCPACGAPLEARTIKAGDRERPVCTRWYSAVAIVQ